MFWTRSGPMGPLGGNDGDDDGQRPWTSLAGLAVVLLLAGLGLLLVHKLADVSKLQDCVLSGRTNCAPVETPHGHS